jgi:hypothetical protein
MSEIRVRLGDENRIKVIPSIGIGGAGAETLGSLNDVDTSELGNGYSLIYNSNTGKWTATNILTPGQEQNLIINGGNF